MAVHCITFILLDMHLKSENLGKGDILTYDENGACGKKAGNR